MRYAPCPSSKRDKVKQIQERIWRAEKGFVNHKPMFIRMSTRMTSSAKKRKNP
jgi:hypothetical protein